MTPTILHRGIKSCDDILRWNECLDVVHRCKYKASARCEVIDAAFHLVDQLLAACQMAILAGYQHHHPKKRYPVRTLVFNSLVFIPFAETWTGFRISNPISIKSGIKLRVAPQLW